MMFSCRATRTVLGSFRRRDYGSACVDRQRSKSPTRAIWPKLALDVHASAGPASESQLDAELHEAAT